MRKFSIARVLTATAFIALAICAVVAQIDNAKLRKQINELEWKTEEANDTARLLEKSNACLIDRNEQTGLGLAFIANLSQDSETHSELISQLGLLTDDSMRCTVKTFPDMPCVRMLIFNKVDTKKSKQPYTSGLFGPRTPPAIQFGVCVLVARDSLQIVDSVCHSGKNGVSDIYMDPWSVHWSQPDGTKIGYRISEVGFTPIEAPETPAG